MRKIAAARIGVDQQRAIGRFGHGGRQADATVVVPTPPLPPATTTSGGRPPNAAMSVRLRMRRQLPEIVSLVEHEEGSGVRVRD